MGWRGFFACGWRILGLFMAIIFVLSLSQGFIEHNGGSMCEVQGIHGGSFSHRHMKGMWGLFFPFFFQSDIFGTEHKGNRV